jgi:hypothetical protein
MRRFHETYATCARSHGRRGSERASSLVYAHSDAQVRIPDQQHWTPFHELDRALVVVSAGTQLVDVALMEALPANKIGIDAIATPLTAPVRMQSSNDASKRCGASA